jgi:hypothetical protein
VVSGTRNEAARKGAHTPATHDARLRLDLTVMPNRTTNLMLILKLSNVYLNYLDIG